MSGPSEQPVDPWRWCLLLALAFVALSFVRLAIPSTPLFDEIHYLPAARELIADWGWVNREHPTLGKQIIALSMLLFGDDSSGWRVMSALFGGLALFAGMRALWFMTLSRFATLAYGVLLATGFALFVHARIAMLDIFMVAFFLVALWQCAAAVREPETGLWRLAIAGVMIGFAMGSKWNVVFLAMVPGLAFFAFRLAAGRRRLFTSQRGMPIPGIALWQAALLLGALPLFAYWLTYWPAYLAPINPLRPDGFVALHREIMALQESVKKPHPYQSTVFDWVFNLRAIWYLYEDVDGAQRGIVLLGNPLTMLVGLPAMIWAAWAGIFRQRWDALAVFVLYAVSLGMWLVVNKPIQFYYHYFLPSCFLLAALALALDELRTRGWGWVSWIVLAGSVGFFVYFYPIISAMKLDGLYSFLAWTWLEGWR
ncbi:glycosyltransferase family 39 protein [Erythrobacter sp. HKB08]|uniref:glycosyltransferase family 39 protein n=1 Tax=Erythrobacter sp. HKB08 TaxID=2502843 RepID=UPI001008E85B|nr:glycosyltransferase family 39 protein [Erythrobacter sp. HKB08]